MMSLQPSQADTIPGKRSEHQYVPPRLAVLTDIGGDPDDEQSLVRLLVYSNEFDIEALINVTANSQKYTLQPKLIRERIMAFGKVRDRLQKHVRHLPAPRNQYPTVRQLLGTIKAGNVDPKVYGIEAVGDGRSSEGSKWLLELADRDDPRPIWVLCWGGTNTLAQALWDARRERSPEQFRQLLSRFRVYPIARQDSAHSWLMDNFPDLWWLDARSVWKGFAAGPNIMDWFGVRGGDESLVTDQWADEHVRSKGPLGALYPKIAFLMEGDTPSFLYLLPNGLNVPDQPGYGGWGGRFTHQGPPFRDHVKDTVDGHSEIGASIWRWREHYQNDFAARMDWTVKSFDQTNHNPVPALAAPRHCTVQTGQTVRLDATASTDPDGDELNYHWMIYREAGTVQSNPRLDDADQPVARLTIPQAKTGQTIHVVLVLTDTGQPALTSYQRIVLTVGD
jgi:hypothetical protein